ncbi:MAG: hypothetical protein WKF90_16495 [Pyrinomonadaceae bacterium]
MQTGSIEKELIIAASPRVEFADIAVELYSSASNYRTAERVGRNVLLPISNYLTDQHVIQLLEKISLNDQIKSASESPDILVKFFDSTIKHLATTKQAWTDFIDTLPNDPDDYYSYPKLREKLVEHNILPAAYPVTTVEIPATLVDG